MTFNYSKENLTPSDAKLQRYLEIIPGATSWLLLLSLIFLSIFYPFIAAAIIVAFYLAWFLRLLYMTLFLLLSYIRLDIERPCDWMARAKGIDHIIDYLRQCHSRHFGRHWRQKISHTIHCKQLEELLISTNLPPQVDDLYHLVIFPVAKEGVDIIEPAITAIKYQLFPTKQIVVAFALEERAEPQIQKGVFNLCEKYKDSFSACFAVVHPANIPGEARVKGANATYAAKKCADYFKERNISFDRIIVSCFDADTVVEENYFTCLSYHFMIHPNRQRCSFQPIPVYHNNIWHVPGFARVIESGSSFFQLVEATNPEKLVTFSSHSMSFQALVEVGYWPVDMISDDSAIFWKCYLHYDGDYQVVPIYVTLSMDVAGGSGIWETIKSVYKQKRRWAWGVENFPLVMRAFMQNKKISWWDKFRHGFKLYEGHLSWATWGFILSIIGWLPMLFARPGFADSIAYYNVPFIAATVCNLGFLCLTISIVLSIALLPKNDTRHSWIKKISFALEWACFPVIVVFLGALPALDAQTRLMFAKYMEFWVTDKKRNPRV